MNKILLLIAVTLLVSPALAYPSAIDLFTWLNPIDHTDLYTKIHDAAVIKGSVEHDENIWQQCTIYLKHPANSTIDPQQLHIAFCSGYIEGYKNHDINSNSTYPTVFSDGRTAVYW